MPALIPVEGSHTQAGAVGFDTPLAMLTECHRRAAERCQTLVRLASHLQTHGVDRRAAEAATVVMRYFDIAAPQHHQDEEEDLFPALRESMAASDAVCLRDLIDRLHGEHRMLDRLWNALRIELAAVAAEPPALLSTSAVQAFQSLYGRHIAMEEADVLPMAERLLSDEVLRQIGQAMRIRRGALN